MVSAVLCVKDETVVVCCLRVRYHEREKMLKWGKKMVVFGV